MAAAFIELGAVNYLESLWPIFDERSRRVAEMFYDGLCRDDTIADAFRAARRDAFQRRDPNVGSLCALWVSAERGYAPARPRPLR